MDILRGPTLTIASHKVSLWLLAALGIGGIGIVGLGAWIVLSLRRRGLCLVRQHRPVPTRNKNFVTVSYPNYYRNCPLESDGSAANGPATTHDPFTRLHSSSVPFIPVTVSQQAKMYDFRPPSHQPTRFTVCRPSQATLWSPKTESADMPSFIAT